MNTDENQKIWIEKVHENLTLRGRSEKTFVNYKSALIKFFKFYNQDTNIEQLKEKDIIEFLNHEYINSVISLTILLFSSNITIPFQLASRD